MSIVSRYLVRHVLTILVMAVGIGTFVMMIGLFAKSLSLLAKGVSMSTILVFLAYRLPELLVYTVPMGLLVAVIMTFNRMSADNEITALRTGGLSLLQVILPLLGLSLLLCALSAVLVFRVAPDLNHRGRWMLKEYVASSFLNLLEPETYNPLGDDIFVYFDRREGDQLYDLRIFRFGEGNVLREDLTAASGTISLDVDAKRLELHLKNVIVVTMEPGADPAQQQPTRLVADTTIISDDFGDDINKGSLMRRPKHMNLSQLLVHVQQISEAGGHPSRALLDLHSRAVLALAPFTFMLIGIPLGIRVGRKETYTGLIMALVVSLLFFGFLTVVEGMHQRDSVLSQLLVWIPNAAGQAIGFWMIWKRR